MLFLSLLACFGASTSSTTETVTVSDVSVTESVAGGVCHDVCPDYSTSWGTSCPPGSRCVTFKNSCDYTVALSYEVGCNSDGTKGAPQCDCTLGPILAPKTGVATFTIVNGDYASCDPSWQPACLTQGLAVMAGKLEVASDGTPGVGAPVCAGPVTRVEFTAGNAGNIYGKFDSWNLSVIEGFGVPVSLSPDLTCAHDYANGDCRTVVCDSATCPDAYSTPTSGGCPDGRSPQVGCQDTFSKNLGITVDFCPSPMPQSCRDATACH